MPLKPLAPNLFSNDNSTIKSIVSSSNVKDTFSNSNKYWYCFKSAFLGCVKIHFNVSLSNGSKLAIIGKRPIISGINPYDFKSAGEI